MFLNCNSTIDEAATADHQTELPTPPEKPTIYYVDAPVGSGKSYALGKYLEDHDGLVTIGTQTNDLSIQYRNELTAIALEAKALFRIELDDKGIRLAKQDRDASVESSSKRYREFCEDRYPILIVNQHVAGRCKEWTASRDLFLDEITAVHDRIQIGGMPVSQAYIVTFLTPHPDDGETSEYVRLVANDQLQKAVEDGWKDPLFSGSHRSIKFVKAFFKTIADDDFDVWVSRESLSKFSKLETEWLVGISVMKPTRYAHYRSVTIIGANFTDSLMYLLWRDRVDFVPHPEIEAKYHHISDNAELVEIYYPRDVDFFSSGFLDRVGRQNFYTAYENVVHELIGSEAHIFCQNNEKSGEDHQWNLPNGTRLSPDSRGINAYKDINVAVHMASLNEFPDVNVFLTHHFKLDPLQVWYATTYERVSQFMGRTAIRKKGATERIKFFVGDLGIAMFLQEKIGCAMPIPFDLNIQFEPVKKRGRKKTKPEISVEERKAAERQRLKEYRARLKAAQQQELQANA